jgi:hypothetical protein
MSQTGQRTIHDRNHAFKLVTGRHIATLIEKDPTLLDLARIDLKRMKTRPNLKDAVRVWEDLLAGDPSRVAEMLSRDDEQGDYVRETKPYFVALDERTTKRLLAEARSLFHERGPRR